MAQGTVSFSGPGGHRSPVPPSVAADDSRTVLIERSLVAGLLIDVVDIGITTSPPGAVRLSVWIFFPSSTVLREVGRLRSNQNVCPLLLSLSLPLRRSMCVSSIILASRSLPTDLPFAACFLYEGHDPF